MCAPSLPAQPAQKKEEVTGSAADATTENERRRLENQVRGLGGTDVIGTALGTTGGVGATKGATVLGATS